jgi:hypothetical protein
MIIPGEVLGGRTPRRRALGRLTVGLESTTIPTNRNGRTMA